MLFTGYDEYAPYQGNDYADQRASIDRLLSIIRDCNRKSCCIECVLLYAKGYNYEEISDKIGIPVGTVKSRISAGRQMLRKAFNE